MSLGMWSPDSPPAAIASSVRLFRLSLVASLAFLATTASALTSVAVDSVPVDLQDDVTYEGWYVVRVGDTLEEITQRYLGDFQRWQENWRLNPDLRNPHNLTPGQRLRILVRSIPEEGAIVTKMSNRVEDQLPPLQWQEARITDVLRPRDSVRTFEASSAELTFGDATRLTLSEESLVFLDRKTTTDARPVTRDQIEIVLGQADLGGRGIGAGGEAIELVIGDAVAVPEPSATGAVQTRARKAEAGAQLMAYEGASSLSAAGVEVEVAEGMGSAVTEGAPPSPPEKLLAAPGLVSPPSGARLMTPRPQVSWDVVDGANGYVVEVCRDADCGELVVRASANRGDVGVWRPEGKLPVADLFWRVTAVSPSGLDGYPSGTRPVTVASHSEDTSAPQQSFEASGPHLPPRIGLNKTWILGPEANLGALADDALSGIDRVEYTLDGEPASEEAWVGPWEPGAHQATLTAVDGAGNRAETLTIPFVYDTAPPALSWGIEGVGHLASVETNPSTTVEDPGPRRAKQRIEVDDPHSFWPWHKQLWTVRHDGHQITMTPSRPVLVTVSEVTDSSSEALTVVLGPERGIWLLAEDEACGPSLHLDYDLDVSTKKIDGKRRGLLELRLSARDGVDNSAGAALQMATSKPTREQRRELTDEKTDG